MWAYTPENIPRQYFFRILFLFVKLCAILFSGDPPYNRQIWKPASTLNKSDRNKKTCCVYVQGPASLSLSLITATTTNCCSTSPVKINSRWPSSRRRRRERWIQTPCTVIIIDENFYPAVCCNQINVVNLFGFLSPSSYFIPNIGYFFVKRCLLRLSLALPTWTFISLISQEWCGSVVVVYLCVPVIILGNLDTILSVVSPIFVIL